MYIDDLIETLAGVCERFVPGEVFNLGGEEYRSVRDVSDLVLAAAGKTDRSVTYLPEDKHNVLRKRPDITRAKERLNHVLRTPLEIGVPQTVAWMRRIYSM
jgi:dTDP-glucose 4,6-dehydratase